MSSDSREYPTSPVSAVGALVIRPDGKLLLVRRGRPPAAGLWTVPGGKHELGETIFECAQREVLEETGVTCEPLGVFYCVDRIVRDEEGRVRYHYVIIDVAARWLSGEASAATDASEAAWFDPEQVADLPTTEVLQHAIDSLRLGKESP